MTVPRGQVVGEEKMVKNNMKELVEKIQVRVLGRTGLKVKMLGVGGISPKEVMEKSLEYGLNFYDVHSYKDSEGVDGRVRFKNAFKKTSLKRSDVVLTGRSPLLTSEEVMKDIDNALLLLETDYLDVYGLYNITQAAGRVEKAMGPGGALEGLKKAKAAGKIRFIGGVSGHHHKELLKLIKTDEFDAVMVSINYFDQDIIKEVLPVTKILNIGTMVMKPFAKGIFTGKPEAALRYVFSRDVSVAIPGMMTVAELECNIRAASGFRGLSKTDMADLKKEADEISKSEGANICRQCGYCVPVCEQKIDIKDIFYMERQANRFYSKEWAQQAYAKLTNNAAKCKECGKCETECPYDLPIRKMLKKTHTDLTSK